MIHYDRNLAANFCFLILDNSYNFNFKLYSFLLTSLYIFVYIKFV